MKVKVFSTKSKAFQSSSKPPYQLEQDINHWIENNPTQSTVMGVKGENIDPHQEFILEIVIILHRQALG